MDKSIFLTIMGESPQLKVIDFLIENSIFDYSKSEISKGASISRNTLNNIWDQLVFSDIITKTRTVGRATLYKLNTKNPVVKKFIQLDQTLTREYAEKLSNQNSHNTTS